MILEDTVPTHQDTSTGNKPVLRFDTSVVVDEKQAEQMADKREDPFGMAACLTIYPHS